MCRSLSRYALPLHASSHSCAEEGAEQRALRQVGTREIMVTAREQLAASKGASALDPWNTGELILVPGSRAALQ